MTDDDEIRYLRKNAVYIHNVSFTDHNGNYDHIVDIEIRLEDFIRILKEEED